MSPREDKNATVPGRELSAQPAKRTKASRTPSTPRSPLRRFSPEGPSFPDLPAAPRPGKRSIAGPGVDARATLHHAPPTRKIPANAKGPAPEDPERGRGGSNRWRGVSPFQGLPSAPRMAVEGPLRGRHLHQARFTVLHWTTSFLGVSVIGGSPPARLLGPPPPPRSRRVTRSGARNAEAGSILGETVPVCQTELLRPSVRGISRLPRSGAGTEGRSSPDAHRSRQYCRVEATRATRTVAPRRATSSVSPTSV